MRFPLLLLAAAFCLSSPTAAAQSAPSDTRVLSLEAALGRAFEMNPALRNARIAVERQAGARRHAAVPVPSNPRISLQSWEQRQPDGSVDKDIAVQLSQEFWVAGQWALREDAADSRLDAARARLDFLESATAARTRAAFLRALVAERSVATAEEIMSANRSLLNFAERRQAAGEASQMEVNTARIGRGRARALVANARNQRERAHLALAELLWIDPATTLELEGEITPSPLQLPSERTLLNRAVQRRGDLLAAGREVTAAREELKLARRKLIPNLQVFARTNSETNVESDVLFGLSFELPLLHRYGGERKQAAADLDEALLAEDSLRLTVRGEVLQALSDYRTSRERLAALSDEALTAARENFRLAMRAFEAGELDATALTSTQTNLIDVRQEYLQALKDLVAAGTALERASGGLIVMQGAGQPASP